MKKSTYIIIVLVLAIAAPFAGSAQNNTSSVYSYFGIGDMSSVGYGRSLALGGTGFAIRDKNSINTKNPASLSSIDSLSFLFETGINGQYTKSRSNLHKQVFWNGNLSHFMFAHRFNSTFSGCLGFMPYTNIGYQMRTSSYPNDNSVKITEWDGSGGINKVFYSLGVGFGKHFSAGLESGFLYGPLSESRKTYYAVTEVLNDNFITVLSTNNYTYNSEISRYYGFNFKAGVQFTTNLNKKGSSLTVGLVASPQTKLRGKTDIYVGQLYDGSSSYDSIYEETEARAKPIYKPLMYGGGVSLTLNNKVMITADYETNRWRTQSTITNEDNSLLFALVGNTTNKSLKYKDQNIYSIGFERLPQQGSLNFFDRCSYRFGLRYDDGYVIVKRYDISDMRFSVGFGMPIQKSRSTINYTFEFGQRGRETSGLIRERFAKLSIAFAFHDYWFVKRQFD